MSPPEEHQSPTGTACRQWRTNPKPWLFLAPVLRLGKIVAAVETGCPLDGRNRSARQGSTGSDRWLVREVVCEHCAYEIPGRHPLSSACKRTWCKRRRRNGKPLCTRCLDRKYPCPEIRRALLFTQKCSLYLWPSQSVFTEIAGVGSEGQCQCSLRTAYILSIFGKAVS